MKMPIKKEVVKTSGVLETCSTHPPTPTPEAKREWKAQKQERECGIVARVTLEKKKIQEKKARFLWDLKTNDLHMKQMNSNVCKNK